MKKRNLVMLTFLAMGLSPICLADSDVVLPPSPPPLSHAEKVAQSRSKSCQDLGELMQERIMTLSGQGTADYKLLCTGVPSSTDQELLDATHRVMEGLQAVIAGTNDVSEAVKITDADRSLLDLQDSIFPDFQGEPTQDEEIFSVAASAN